MNQFDWGWVTGLIEGDGHIGRSHSTALVSIEMTDRDTIDRVAGLLRPKSVTMQRHHGGHRKDTYRVGLYGSRAIDLMRLLREHMSLRKQAQIDGVLAWWESRPVRRRALRGSECHSAKVSEQHIPLIRYLCDARGMLHKDVGSLCGLSRQAIDNIVNRKTWRSVE